MGHPRWTPSRDVRREQKVEVVTRAPTWRRLRNVEGCGQRNECLFPTEATALHIYINGHKSPAQCVQMAVASFFSSPDSFCVCVCARIRIHTNLRLASFLFRHCGDSILCQRSEQFPRMSLSRSLRPKKVMGAPPSWITFLLWPA